MLKVAKKDSDIGNSMQEENLLCRSGKEIGESERIHHEY